MVSKSVSIKEVCVCILAHNEQRHIAATIRAIAADCRELDCDIKVYANGCTDATCEVVHNLTREFPNVFLRELSQASKPAAWNTAFGENRNPILVFSDGDVVPEAGAIPALCGVLSADKPQAVLVGCSLWPRKIGLTAGQRFTGFLQIPLRQDFLAGALYAVARDKFQQRLRERQASDMPLGLTADDAFIEFLVPRNQFTVVKNRVFYEPPALKDYWKYLARIRWQNEQLLWLNPDRAEGETPIRRSLLRRLGDKLAFRQSPLRTLIGVISSSLRLAVKTLFARRIRRCYRALGPVGTEGRHVLTQATRSVSVK